MTQDTKKKVHVQDHTVSTPDPLAGMTDEQKEALLTRLAAEKGMVLKKAGKDNKDEFKTALESVRDMTMRFCSDLTHSAIPGAFAVTLGRDLDGFMFCDVKRLRKREVKAKPEVTAEPAPAPQPGAPATTQS